MESTSMEVPGLKQMQVMKRERQNEQIMIYLFVLAMYLFSFWIGLLGWSLFWIFLISLVTFVVWKRRVFSLTERYIREKESILLRKKALRQSESCEWLNFIINRWLVFSCNTLSSVLKGKIDPLLNQLQPYFLSSLELKKVNFDTKTPCIQSIVAFEVDEGNRKPVTWSNVVAPPPGLKLARKYQVVVEAKVELLADEFMELTARLNGKWMGLSLDVSIEKLDIKALLQITFHLDMNTPFPHFSAVSVLLTEKPDLHFGVRVLRHVQLMEIPLLKLWIYNIVTNMLTEAFVDPGKLEFSLDKAESTPSITGQQLAAKLAVGVVTVTVNGTYKAGEKKKSKQFINPLELLSDTRCCSIAIDDQEFPSMPISSSSSFTHSASFLISNLSEDKVKISLNSKVFLMDQSLVSVILPLSKYSLENKHSNEETQEHFLERSSETLKLSVRLEYTPLTPWDSLVHGGATPIPESLKMIKTGVINVCIHGASELMGLDPDGLSDPYCILYNNGGKLINTHYVSHTRNPCWEVFSQFIVEDISKVVLSFVVYDWDGMNSLDDDFLGSTHVIMTQSPPKIIYQSFSLNASLLALGESPMNRGTIIISIIFIPIENISVQCRDVVQDQVSSLNSPFTSLETLQKSENKFPLLTSNGILDISIIQATNLIAKDRNGLSDPFCEVYVGKQKRFSTSVKKKTLNPVWNEQCTLELPREDETLEISVWDHDLISRNDFIGSLVLSRKQLVECGNDKQHDGWFRLEKVPSGMIQAKFRVFIQEADPAGEFDWHSNQLEFNSKTPWSEGRMQLMTGEIRDVAVKANAEDGRQEVQATTDMSSSQSMPSSSSCLNGQLVCDSSFKSFGNETRLSKRFHKSLSRLSALVHSRRQNKTPEPCASYELYAGIRVEVNSIEGLPSSSGHFHCKVRLHSIIDNQKKTLARSSQFTPSATLPMDFNFEVCPSHGESKMSSLVFSIKSGRFSTIVEKSFKLQEILPNESRRKRINTLNLDGVLLHLSCSFDRMQPGCNVSSHKVIRS